MAYNDNIIENLRHTFDVEEGKFTNCALVFAYNGTGKTRLSYDFAHYGRAEGSPQHTLYYNAYTEDLFIWDNDIENESDNRLHQLNVNTSSALIKGLPGYSFEGELRKYLHAFTDIDFKFEYNNSDILDHIVFSKKTRHVVELNDELVEVEGDPIENIKK